MILNSDAKWSWRTLSQPDGIVNFHQPSHVDNPCKNSKFHKSSALALLKKGHRCSKKHLASPKTPTLLGQSPLLRAWITTNFWKKTPGRLDFAWGKYGHFVGFPIEESEESRGIPDFPNSGFTNGKIKRITLIYGLGLHRTSLGWIFIEFSKKSSLL